MITVILRANRETAIREAANRHIRLTFHHENRLSTGVLETVGHVLEICYRALDRWKAEPGSIILWFGQRTPCRADE